MATITLFAFFTDKGVPKTGLTPLISGRKKDDTQVINAQAMTELTQPGCYYYDFAAYDEAEDYIFVADGTASLIGSDRYKSVSNDIGQVTEDITGVKSDTEAILINTDTMEADLKTYMDIKESNVRGADSDDLKDISDQVDTVQTDLDNPNQYKADVAALAIEANVEGHVTNSLNTYNGITRTEATSDKDEIIVEINDNETKIDTVTTLVTRALGLMQENHYLDTTVYDSSNNLTSGRIRTYSVAGSVGTDSDVLATYTITATYNVESELQTYSVVKV